MGVRFNTDPLTDPDTHDRTHTHLLAALMWVTAVSGEPVGTTPQPSTAPGAAGDPVDPSRQDTRHAWCGGSADRFSNGWWVREMTPAYPIPGFGPETNTLPL